MRHNLQSKSIPLFTVWCMFFLVLFATKGAYAQLTGSIAVPSTNYATIKSVVDSLNLYGVGPGGVTFNVATGYSETVSVGGLKLSASGTAANPIIIQNKSGNNLE